MTASLCISQCSAQSASEGAKFVLETLNQPDIGKEELLTKFGIYDYSSLWIENDNNILGFIGENYQRIKIKYLSIIKNNGRTNHYYVYGKSKVKSNICQFQGEIEIVNIRKINNEEESILLEEAKKQKDEEAIKRLSVQKFILLGKYVFYEDSKQKGAGIFQGNFRSDFYIDGNIITYNDLNKQSDSFSNNQFVGTWTSYMNSIVKRCNWGEFRIPYSGDLDIGVGDFSPNKKYIKNGWEGYYKAYIQNDVNIQNEEEQAWWL